MWLAGKFIAFIVSLSPVKYRFKVVVFVSTILTPFFQAMLVFQQHKKNRYMFERDTPIALMWCLRTLNNIELGLTVTLNDAKIKKSTELNKGVFITCYHGTLMPLIITYLQDKGYNIITVGRKEKEVIFGRFFDNEIQNSSTFLLKIRRYLRRGEIVAAMIDIYQPHERAIEIDTVFGKFFISDALFRVAANCEAEVLFLKYKLIKDKVSFEIGRASSLNMSHETITADYINFLRD